MFELIIEVLKRPVKPLYKQYLQSRTIHPLRSRFSPLFSRISLHEFATDVTLFA